MRFWVLQAALMACLLGVLLFAVQRVRADEARPDCQSIYKEMYFDEFQACFEWEPRAFIPARSSRPAILIVHTRCRRVFVADGLVVGWEDLPFSLSPRGIRCWFSR